MEANKRIETMEEELKLMKGELKQSLASVRDYLLNMELPSSEFATVIAALGGEGGETKITMKGSFSPPPDSGSGRSAREEPSPEEPQEEPLEEEPFEELIEPESELPQEDGLIGQDESLMPASGLPQEDGLIGQDESLMPASGLPQEDGLIDQGGNLGPASELLSEEEPLEEEGEEEPGEQDEYLMPESELLTEEEQQMERGKINTEVSQSTPKVNLLANLIQWVSRAKKEIGSEELPIFLEVYGISGHMSPELKEVILHMADVASDQPEDVKTAEIWSQSMLSLHGILTGGNAPLYPVKPLWNDGGGEIQLSEDEVTESEADKSKDMPLKLKLVFPNGDGKSQEFCINLNPEVDNNGS